MKQNLDYPKNLMDAVGTNDEELLIGLLNDNDFLNEREQRIIKLRFEEGLTLAKIGAEYGVSATRIRQLEAIAIRKLKDRIDWIIDISVASESEDCSDLVWHKLSDKQPKDGERVLVVYDRTNEVEIAMYDATEPTAFLSDGGVYYSNREIKVWMKLPRYD